MMKNKWPKRFAPLTAEQQTISNDFMKYWHEVLPRRYGFVDKFNHNYVAVDIRNNMVAEIRKACPNIQAIVADCQQRIDYPDEHFDRILAIHVLEHLPDLPAAIAELYRLCDKTRGVLSIVIPCEGGGYSLARKISAQRIFEKWYKQSYQWFIEREHINRPAEIFEELAPYFTLQKATYFPIPVKSVFFNLCIGATLAPK